ncbi:heavy-metal-associated domain-containing protein [Flavobacteriaceae bacterium XHP0103]|uniref:heavy-metal-associated domain-containing protein n=1 Tax=Marixanthotalea marina TaxID=2844359 RepID=UPI002989A90B|nr:heavy-metal-associated domain-containing protein [Marixanthotalea marina]MBU3822059.1 heavy-metal-associated domain-containing protein [Marixanthotalea marina]
MNKLIFILMIAVGVVSCKNETKSSTNEFQELAITTTSFGVRGNCEMCKKTIENAANGVEGVANADWNVEQKKIEVSFDGSKTNEMAIHKAIAASGYDTDKVLGNEQAYNGLPSCCQYDHNMEMNQ